MIRLAGSFPVSEMLITLVALSPRIVRVPSAVSGSTWTVGTMRLSNASSRGTNRRSWWAMGSTPGRGARRDGPDTGPGGRNTDVRGGWARGLARSGHWAMGGRPVQAGRLSHLRPGVTEPAGAGARIYEGDSGPVKHLRRTRPGHWGAPTPFA